MASMILWKRGVLREPINLGSSDGALALALADMKASTYIKLDGAWQRPTESIKKAYYHESDKTWSTVTAVIASEVRDTQANPAILGYGFGLGGTTLYGHNKDSFDNDIEAQEVLNLIDEAFPELPAYRATVVAEAHDNKLLVSLHGYLRRFWDMYHFVYNPADPKKWIIKHGSDYEDAIAFRPANDAFGYLDLACIRLDDAGWMERGRFVNTVHRSVIFYLRNDLFDVAVNELKTEIEKPSSVLVNEICPNGLSIEVEVAAGDNWGSMRKLKT